MYKMNEATLDLLGRIQERMEVQLSEKKWVQGAIKQPGRLHKHFGVPEGEKIPMAKIKKEYAKLKAKKNKSDDDKSLMHALQLGMRLKGGDVPGGEKKKGLKGESADYAMDEITINVLGRIRLEMEGDMEDLGDAAAGEGGADNPSDVDDALDLYLDSIVERLVNAGADERDAEDLIFLVADDCEENGDLPPMPGEDASEDEISLWMGKAKTYGFTKKVLSAVGL